MINEKRDFFISFSSADKPIADWITYELKRKGFTMYYQFDDFPPGSDFMQEMNKAMLHTKLTIAIWTANYFSSSFACLEARTVLKQSLAKKEIKLVPVKIDDCDVDPLFSTLVYINLIGKTEFEAQKLLLNGINASLSVGKTSDVKKKPSYPINPIQTESLKTKKEGFLIQKPLKVLYAGSKKSSSLDLEDSYQILAKGITKHLTKGIIKFNKALNLNTTNIFDILLREKPHVFHFSGKQDGGDIRITDENNNVTTISDAELAGFLTSFGDNIKLAIIDTCYSYNCAKSISDVVDFAIGVKDAIYTNNADSFYKIFYNSLCSGYSLKDAVGQATAYLKFRKNAPKEIPVLLCKETADPSKAYFVDV